MSDNPELNKLREQIDDVDGEILNHLNERVRLAMAIGRLKAETGSAVYVPSREEAVFRKLADLNEGPLTEKAIRAIYREIISSAISLESGFQVAYLGPEGTYTHQAAIKNFGSSVPYLPFRTVPDIFTAVKRGDAEYGVVPIENSTQGTVITTLDMLVESNLTIVAQIHLEIAHCLISYADLNQIREVHSKDNALGQCREWLARMLPQAELVDAASTAAAVKHAAEHHDTAAIGSRIAADMYGVPILKENIMDKENNVTRFLVVCGHETPRLGGGRDKTSLVFTLHDEAGALLKALLCFSSRGINLSKIESRPSRRKVWDYYFYVDVIGHRDDPQIRDAVTELERLCPFVKWLGSYPNTGY